MSNKAAILFDLDGTLVNSLVDICGVVNLVRQHYSLVPMPIEDVRVKVGKGMDYLVTHCFTDLQGIERSHLVNSFRDLYFERPHHGGELYPGVLETLHSLRGAGLRVAVATNKQTRIAKRTLEHYLPEFVFDLVHGHDAVSERKPSPKHITETLSQLGVDPANAWMVGDDNVDKASAQGAGVRFLAASWGFGRVQAEKHESLQRFEEVLDRVLCNKV